MTFVGSGGLRFGACDADDSVSTIGARGHDYTCAHNPSHLTSVWFLRSHTNPGGNDNICSF